MAEEEKYVTCPCCDGKIRWIKEFPLAQITSFDYLPLPSSIKGPVEAVLPLYKQKQRRFFRKKSIYIPQIPADIEQMLAQSNEFSYEGKIYERVTLIGESLGEVKEDFFAENLNVSEEELEKAFGSHASKPGVRIYTDFTNDVKDFLSCHKDALRTLEASVGKIIPTKDIFSLLSINYRCPTDLRDFSFSIGKGSLGECVLDIDSGRYEADIHFGYGPGAYMAGFSLEVAKFAYKGLFRER